MVPPSPPPALAAAVRGGAWAEVRRLAATLPSPVPPAVTLALARARESVGELAPALVLLREALPGAGELAPALRLEAARLAIQLDADPAPFLAPLLGRRVPEAQRQLAFDLLRSAWQKLPLAVVARHRSLPLGHAAQRELTAILAVRAGDEAAAIRLLRHSTQDLPAQVAARWLAGRDSLPRAVLVPIGETLLAGGWWRDAERVLAEAAPPAKPEGVYRLAFLRGRTAYRLGQLGEAARRFQEAFAAAAKKEDRFAAAVQLARVAGLRDEPAAAVVFWDAARTAAPHEVEGWDGGARARAATGRFDEAVALLERAPRAVQHVAGPRLAALLLARKANAAARRVLARLPQRLPAARGLRLVSALRRHDLRGARRDAVALIADRRAGAWREVASALLPVPSAPPSYRPPASADVRVLASIAFDQGTEAARRSLARALAAEPAWARLLAGSSPRPSDWTGPAADLHVVGLNAEAARIFPDRFPASCPGDLAWSAAALAEDGNGPAALDYGERLWATLAGIPANFLPETVRTLVLPPALVADCSRAAADAGVPGSWLVALVRQESRFDRGARSPAGALGVAQMVPDTATRLGVTADELWDEDLSLRLAAREIARLRGRYAARLPLVAAAYNAGDLVVEHWMKTLGGTADDVLFTAAIPYGETSGYVLAAWEGAALARHLK
jgi:soluble lytic murein transglycosylase-like protein